jgi:hypothetical protein
MNVLRLPRPRQVLAACAVALAAGASHAGGLDIHADADAKDVGLPIYPGAVKNADSDRDTAGFSFGIWGEAFGFKLAVASYRSADGADAVAAFYRDAMRPYGPVLDCTGVHAKPGHHRDDPDNQNKPVTCDDDSVKAGGHLFKVGINRAQRVFKVTPTATGSKFELVRVEMHGTD